ncbi:ABC transporter family substrate-binding protein [Nonomuraea deserti]|uniref:ABC transporter family substrate-binding protein n=1 Tax=Nonomuraea deserti TaxID=1848322 RepID=A0A4R4W236_9ACTN|nr:ABC transporter family substrate-binding protein [Nonomuraea deserti]TDD11901.1 ABC transporter family substrate-binding protein [Nonomuraea deserti]
MAFRRKHSLALTTSAVALLLAACAGGGGTASGDGRVTGDVNTANTAKVAKGGTATYTITYPISNWNVLNSAGATYSVLDISSVLLPGAFMIKPDGTPVRNETLVTSAEKVGDSPQTIKYTIDPKAVWSDGRPISADDFIYTWRALDPRECPKCQASNTAGYDRIKSVKGSDGGRTVTVVFDKPYVDWQALFSPFLPAHVAETYGPTDTAAGLEKSFNEGFAKSVPKFSAGPFRIQEYTSDGSVVLVRNEKWFGTPPNLEKLVFRLITDVAQQPTSLANGEVDVIYPNPQVDIVQQVEELPAVRYQVTPGASVHKLWLNLNARALQDVALRKAIFQAVRVQDVIDKTIGQFDDTAEPLLSHMFIGGAPGYSDVVSELDYGIGDVGKAKKTLTDAGYTGVGSKLADPDGKAVPPLRIVVQAGDQLRASEAQLVKAALAPLGLDVQVATVANTIEAVQEGNWAMTVATVSQSPFATTSNIPYYLSCPEGSTFCRFNLNNYGNPKVDRLLNEALSATSAAAATKKLQEADRIVSSDYAILPLYQNRSFLAYSAKLGNVRDNSLGFPTYNTEQWGLLGES